MGTPRTATARWQKLRLQVLRRDGYVCHYCQVDLPKKGAHVDHLLPVDKYPELTYQLDNLVAACRRCNLSKGNREGPPPTLDPTYVPRETARRERRAKRANDRRSGGPFPTPAPPEGFSLHKSDIPRGVSVDSPKWRPTKGKAQ